MNNKRATIIYNPMSGRPARRAEDVRRMIGLLDKSGIFAEAYATAGPSEATQLVSSAVAAGADVIICYGGDGTLNEAVQGMVGSQTPLAVWPGGTANVVARDLGIPFQVNLLADMIAAGRTTRIALGLAKSERETGRGGDWARGRPSRYFVMMAGIGLDASIASSVNKRLKRRTGEFAYWLSGLKHLFTWKGDPFTIDVDGKRYQTAFALIGNGKGYGGGMVITPGARLEEPWFEVYVLPQLANNFAYLRALSGCMRGKPEIAGVRLVRGRHIKANSAHEPWVEADGELIGPLPMTFEVVPDALSLIVP